MNTIQISPSPSELANLMLRFITAVRCKSLQFEIISDKRNVSQSAVQLSKQDRVFVLQWNWAHRELWTPVSRQTLHRHTSSAVACQRIHTKPLYCRTCVYL